MSYYLLNHLSTGVLIVVIVGVPTVAALVVAFRGGWDLIRVGGKELEPPDVISLFEQPSRFCRDPTRGPPARTAAPAPLGANVRR
ncbi:MAG: hypothetical protein QOF69_3364 [Solirubrobacteraceae bacterium]|nr:hypothetical protein [Solirubrobacteraceae bacterium]